MPAENPINISAEIKQRFNGALEAIMPGLREHRLRAEQARVSLDAAYSELGGESGIEVSLEQVHNVLQAELGVLQTASSPDPKPSYANQKYIEGTLKFYTKNGLFDASTLMFVRADHWREIAHDQKLAELDPGRVRESQRRATACERAHLVLSEAVLDLRSSQQ